MPLGHTNNPNGRPLGSRNKRSGFLLPEGHTDPAEHLSSIVTDPNQPAELRAAAANYLLPYRYSKKGATPPLRFIEEPLQLPHPNPTTLAHFRDNIVYLSDMKAQGRLDLDTADSLINDQQWGAKIMGEELALAIKGQGEGEQVIRIENSLPQLPGTNVAQDPDGRYAREPVLAMNGHNGAVIDHQEPPAIKSVPSEASEP